MELTFSTAMGYLLGMLIIFVVGWVFLKPVKFIIRLAANSVLGGVFIWIINLLGKTAGIHIGLNPVTAIVAGALGIPGVILILLLQIFY